MKKIFFIMITFILCSSIFAVQNSNIIFSFFDLGVGARAAGMGEAFTSVADDSSAVYWNPAGLGLLNNIEISVTYDKWFMDTFYQHMTAGFPLSIGTIGIDTFYMNYGKFESIDDSGVSLNKEIYPYNFGGSIAYGIKLNKSFLLGVSSKFIYQTIDDNTNFGFAFDTGGIFRINNFSIGFNIQNLGVEKSYNLPIKFNLGGSFNLLDLNNNLLILAIKGSLILNADFILNLGAEYVFMRDFSLRVGYKIRLDEANEIEELNGIGFGLGYGTSFMKIDYAIVFHGELGQIHKIALTFKFDTGNKEKTNKK